MLDAIHLPLMELEAGLEHIRKSPTDKGKVMLIVRRPDVNMREAVDECQLDPIEGLVGDNWKARGSKHTEDGAANPNMQITIMNVRVIELLAQSKLRWPLAGDQLYIDLDLSEENMPPGTQITVGSATLEVSTEAHNGCNKFAERYGTDATKFVNSKEGRQLHLRGVNAKVVRGGTVRVGDIVTRE